MNETTLDDFTGGLAICFLQDILINPPIERAFKPQFSWFVVPDRNPVNAIFQSTMTEESEDSAYDLSEESAEEINP